MVTFSDDSSMLKEIERTVMGVAAEASESSTQK